MKETWMLVALTMTCAAGIAPAMAQEIRSARTDTAAANKLHERAIKTQADRRKVASAARLHKRDAELRAPDDPHRIDCLVLAAHLYYYANQMDEARITMEAAATQALELGNVVRAANAYLDAAFVAGRLNQRDEFERLSNRAVLLTASPLLTDESRNRIRQRLAPAPANTGVTMSNTRRSP